MTKKIITLLSLFLIVSFFPIAYAKPEKSPTFPTYNEVSQMITDALIPVQESIDGIINEITLLTQRVTANEGLIGNITSSVEDIISELALLTQRVTANEDSIEDLSSSIGQTEDPYIPTLPNAPHFRQVTFSNWPVSTSGGVTGVADLDATGYKYIWLAGYCGQDAELRLEYSHDHTNWFVQRAWSPEECSAGIGDNSGFYVQGKFYRVSWGPTDAPSQFLYVEARFYK
ncbi:hypothetical protein ACFL15_02325 [Patescibacteria group bacterium]